MLEFLRVWNGAVGEVLGDVSLVWGVRSWWLVLDGLPGGQRGYGCDGGRWILLFVVVSIVDADEGRIWNLSCVYACPVVGGW